MGRRRGHPLSAATKHKISLALRGNANARRNADVGARHSSRLDSIKVSRFRVENANKRLRAARGPSAAQSAARSAKKNQAELETHRAVAKALKLRMDRPKREKAARARVEVKRENAYPASIQIAPSKFASAGATQKPSGSFASKAKPTSGTPFVNVVPASAFGGVPGSPLRKSRKDTRPTAQSLGLTNQDGSPIKKTKKPLSDAQKAAKAARAKARRAKK